MRLWKFIEEIQKAYCKYYSGQVKVIKLFKGNTTFILQIQFDIKLYQKPPILNQDS